MRNRQQFKTGEIVISKLHPKIGEVVYQKRNEWGEMVFVRWVDGSVGQVPFRLTRYATAEELAEYNRRKSESSRQSVVHGQ